MNCCSREILQRYASFLLCITFFLISVSGLRGQTDSIQYCPLLPKKIKTEGYNLKVKIKDYYQQKHKQALFVLPFASWNNYDKWYFGAGIFTNPVAETTVRFRFFPGWSFSADNLNYAGHISMDFTPGKGNMIIEPFLSAQSYSYQQHGNIFPSYVSLHGGMNLFPASNVTFHRFSIALHYSEREFMKWSFQDNAYFLQNETNTIAEVNVMTNTLRFADKNEQTFRAEFNKDIMKTSLTAIHKIQYNDPSKSFSLRFFGGVFLSSKNPITTDYRFRLSGIQGRHDYTFSNVYLSRSESGKDILHNQIYPEDGFFKTLTPLGQTWKWLVAVNMKTDFPGKIPLQFYLDLGTYEGAGKLYPESKNIPWNCGLAIPVCKERFEIYIPLFMSEDIRHYYDINSISFLNRITWMIRFDELNPFKTLKK